MEQATHSFQHFANCPIIDRDLALLYDLPPAAYQRIVNDLVNLVAAVLGTVPARGEPGLAQAVAGAIWMGYDGDVAERVQGIPTRARCGPNNAPYRDSTVAVRYTICIGDRRQMSEQDPAVSGGD